MKLRGINANCGIPTFYDNVAMAMGLSIENCHYSCSHIKVSQSVADAIMGHYEKEGADQMSIAMMWLNWGPKTDENLSEDMVEVEEGFYTHD